MTEPDAAAALRADLTNMQSHLDTQVRLVKATYYTLPAAQQSLLGPGGAVPTVGMGGLVPNARILAAYIIATYPGVQTIGGGTNRWFGDYQYFTLNPGETLDFFVTGSGVFGDNTSTFPTVGTQGGKYYVFDTDLNVPTGSDMQFSC